VEITASMVKDLREKTGAGMMDCKKALEETGGDFDKAATLLRQKGIAVAAKRESKVTCEGIIGSYGDDKTGALVELACETDFVAKTDEFMTLAKNIATQVAKPDFCDKCEIGDKPYIADPSRTVSEVVSEVMGKLGEKIVVKRYAKITTDVGAVGTYIHTGDKIGVLVELACDGDAGSGIDDLKTVARDIAMQIAWGSPQYITREEVPESKIEEEKEVHRVRAVNEGKPEAAIDKIVAGRLEKFFSEVVLLDQPFIRDASITIADLLKDTSTKIGKKVELKRFLRFRVGEQE
jgi:elongation factor Ts